MKFTQLGNTGVTVSKVCLGCMSYGSSKWRPWVLDEEASQHFFQKAVESGINFFDTADMYSLGASEEVTGRALKKYANTEEIVLATKVRFPITSKPNMGGLSRKHVIQGCEASLKRLGVDTIDLYQLHRMDPGTPIEETLAALNFLVQQGKVRYIGMSSCYAWELAQALNISERNGWAKFVAMQNHYNLVYREEEREMMALCRKERIGVIPWSPLARGLLAGSRKSLEDKESTTRAGSDNFSQILYNHPSDMEVVEAVRSVADARGTGMAQVALAWLASRPGVTAPIFGATKMSHLEAAIEAADLQLTDDEVAALEKPYIPHKVSGLFA